MSATVSSAKSVSSSLHPRLRVVGGRSKRRACSRQVLAHGQLGVERESLRHEADFAARVRVAAIHRDGVFHVAALDRLAKQQRRPSVGGSSPVSIFIVVVLPQPLEPRKPKISPRSMRKLTWSTAVKVPNRCVSPCASITGGPPVRVTAG